MNMTRKTRFLSKFNGNKVISKTLSNQVRDAIESLSSELLRTVTADVLDLPVDNVVSIFSLVILKDHFNNLKEDFSFSL